MRFPDESAYLLPEWISTSSVLKSQFPNSGLHLKSFCPLNFSFRSLAEISSSAILLIWKQNCSDFRITLESMLVLGWCVRSSAMCPLTYKGSIPWTTKDVLLSASPYTNIKNYLFGLQFRKVTHVVMWWCLMHQLHHKIACNIRLYQFAQNNRKHTMQASLSERTGLTYRNRPSR